MKKLLLSAVAVVTSGVASAEEVWQKNPVGPYGREPESDYAVTIDGARWLVRESAGSYWLGSYILDYPVLSNSAVGDVTVPSSLRGSVVRTIPDEAFSGCNKITSITIPASITYIGDFWTFGGCSCLTNFIVEVGNTAYCAQDGLLLSKDKTCLIAWPCGKKGELVMPSSVTTIAGCAFAGCGFASIKIPEGVVSIGRYAFSSCETVKTIEFPESLKTIGDYSLIGCGGWSQGASIDFKGPPPTGIESADITTGSAIRYNIAYEDEWLPVVTQCGWTNAKPYEPLSLATPVISPASGTTFDTSLTVSMTCASEEATIHFTTNGTVPTIESAVYSRKFKIYSKTTVKAIAFWEDGTPSEMAVAEYAMGQCEDPVIRPSDGSVFEHSGQRVSIAWEETNGVLRVTTDGSDPTPESPEYTAPFTIDETTVVKAKVFGDQYFDSSIVTATLTRVWVKVATPVIAAQATFTGSKQRIDIGCATEGAIVRYTTNGQDPNSHSTKYKGPFYVTDTTTVKAYATKADYMNSDIATLAISKVRGIGDTMGKPDHAFETSGAKGFVRVEDVTATLGESMKSGAITDYEKSILSTTVIGPGTLTFKWKASCEQDDEYEWDHGEFRVNGEPKGWINGVTDWIEVSQRIDGEGTNTVTWTYVKDDVESVDQDCIWVSDYAWASDYTTTQTTQVPVPYDWLREKSRDAVDEYDIYEKVAKQAAYNPRFTVEQCYVAGLDPESTTNEFTSAITMEDGVPKITWKPDLFEEREYKVWGKAALEGTDDWAYPTNSTHRFFKVSVEMPE